MPGSASFQSSTVRPSTTMSIGTTTWPLWCDGSQVVAGRGESRRGPRQVGAGSGAFSPSRIGLARGADCERGPQYGHGPTQRVRVSLYRAVTIHDVGIELQPAWSDRRCSPLPVTQRPYTSGQKMLMRHISRPLMHLMTRPAGGIRTRGRHDVCKPTCGQPNAPWRQANSVRSPRRIASSYDAVISPLAYAENAVAAAIFDTAEIACHHIPA
jgi:hypothetical protein